MTWGKGIHNYILISFVPGIFNISNILGVSKLEHVVKNTWPILNSSNICT